MEVNLRIEGSGVQGIGVIPDLIFLAIYKEAVGVEADALGECEVRRARIRVDLGPHCGIHGISPSTCTTGEKGPSSEGPGGMALGTPTSLALWCTDITMWATGTPRNLPEATQPASS